MTPDPIRVILDDIRHIVRALHVGSRAAERECGLSAAQLFVLRQLEGGERVSINELALRTMTHQSSVSVVVRRLAEQKLVSRRTAASDSRKVEVSLTEAGRRTLQTAPRALQENLVEALRRMRATERATLAQLLTKLVTEAGFDEGRAPLLFED